MKYMLLIHDEESQWEKMPASEQEAQMAEYRKFTDELQASGAYQSADRLRPAASATTVRVRDGRRMVTDGPYAETKEQFGGYYLIDVKDLDDAIRWAEKIPSVRFGSIEIRPLWEC